jgi:hypothetical protein
MFPELFNLRKAQCCGGCYREQQQPAGARHARQQHKQ